MNRIQPVSVVRPLQAARMLLHVRRVLSRSVNTVITAAALVVPNHLLAQEVEEVVVTGQGGQSEMDALLDDATSFSAIDGDKLADAGIENVEDVAAYVPNLALTQTTTGTNIVIRGIGSGNNQGFDQSVGLYIDSVPLPRSQMARAPFLDLAGVQVLRGPQYVRDGNYSLAGSIHLVTRQAADEFESGLNMKLTPSQGGQSLLATVSSPLGDRAGIRMALQRKSSDGYIENVTLGRDDGGSDDLLGRLVLNFAPSDDLAFKFKAEYGSFDTTGRAIEVFQDEPVPDIGTFYYGPGTPYSAPGEPSFAPVTLKDRQAAEVWTLGGTNVPNVINTVNAAGVTTAPRLPLTENQRTFVGARWALATGATTDIDRSYIPQGVRYDSAADRRLIIDNPTLDDNRVPIYGGRSYFDILSQLYTGTAGPYAARFKQVYRDPTGVPPPRGLEDTALDFRRGTDIDEQSENESLNLTLNVDGYLGEHGFKGIVSYIDYEYSELIDGDFTPVPLLEISQSEEYSQSFFRLEYASPADSLIRFSSGFSYLDSTLKFTDKINPLVDRPQNLADFAPFTNALSPQRTVDFNPDFPFISLLGRDAGALISGAEALAPLRIFEQDTKIFANFLELEVDFTDEFRAALGLRYTSAEKTAVRDLSLVWEDGSALDLAAADPSVFVNGRAQTAGLERAISSYEVVFGIQLHSDTFQPGTNARADIGPDVAIRGTRREETLLPSLNFAWDANDWLTLRLAARMANKLGGYDARSAARPDITFLSPARPGTFEFEDENAITYELGGNFLFNSGFLNSTLFYTQFEDLQVSASDGRVGTNVRNAGAARTIGLEIESQIALGDKLGLNFSGAWIDFEFTEFPFGSCILGDLPDFVLLTNPPSAPTSTATQATLIETYPEMVNVNSTGAEFQAAWERYFEFTRTGGGFLVPVEYGTEPFPGDLNATQPENVQKLLDYTFGYAPFGFNVESGAQFPEGVYVNDRSGRSPTSSSQFNTNEGNFASFCDFKGKTNQYVAELQGTMALSYESEIRGLSGGTQLFGASLDVLYNSGYHTTVTLDPDAEQAEYVLFNGRLALKSLNDTWEIALLGQNLTNEKVVSFAAETPIGSRVIGSKGHFGFVRPGRALSLDLRYNFY